MPNLEDIRTRRLTPENRRALENLVKECRRFEPCSGAAHLIEEAISQERYPEDNIFDDLVLELSGHIQPSLTCEVFTVAYIIQYVVYQCTLNSGVREFASLADYSVFNIDDPEQGYVHHIDKVDLKFIVD